MTTTQINRNIAILAQWGPWIVRLLWLVVIGTVTATVWITDAIAESRASDAAQASRLEQISAQVGSIDKGGSLALQQYLQVASEERAAIREGIAGIKKDLEWLKRQK